jgi:hypothetical protein
MFLQERETTTTRQFTVSTFASLQNDRARRELPDAGHHGVEAAETVCLGQLEIAFVNRTHIDVEVHLAVLITALLSQQCGVRDYTPARNYILTSMYMYAGTALIRSIYGFS